MDVGVEDGKDSSFQDSENKNLLGPRFACELVEVLKHCLA